MKKKIEERTAARRLKLRREILRNLDIAELTAVASGVPQCQVTRTTGTC
jgi:hypothetical protein